MKNNLTKFIDYIIKELEIHHIVFIIFIILILIWLHHIKIRKQYSNEGWKIKKKNGRKSVFWYDENGNIVYRKPKRSNPPNRHKRGL